MPSEIRESLFDGRLFESKSVVHFELGGCKRIEMPLQDSGSKIVDIHGNLGVQFHFLKVNAGDGYAEFTLGDYGAVSQCLHTSEMGILLRVKKEDREYTIWLPPGADKCRFDKYKRIEKNNSQRIPSQAEVFPRICLKIKRPESFGEVVTFAYVVYDDPTGQFYQELAHLQDVERRHYMKSEWFSVRAPSDVWKYLLDGSIYDPRADKRIGKRFKCQQCAYSLWSYFGFLNLETGKQVYDIMQDEIAFSVLKDMGSNGEWGHGFWSDDIETHARFHLDGLHLLISQYEKTQEPMWLKAVERGVSFLSLNLMEQLDNGSLWFLHDTIEYLDKRCHFKSTLFGKSIGNSLCINTHVQALTVLFRLRQYHSEKHNYAEMFERGLRSLRRVLACKSGEPFFKVLVPWIVRNITWTDCNSNVGRVVRALEASLLRGLYWQLRRQFPRIVQPGGFTERDLTLAFFSHSYHVSNMKDFLTLYQQEPIPWLRDYIEDGIKFACNFVKKMGVKKALRSGVHYVELIDVLYLYNKLISAKFEFEINMLEKEIYEEMAGYSLDCCILKSEQRSRNGCVKRGLHPN